MAKSASSAGEGTPVGEVSGTSRRRVAKDAAQARERPRTSTQAPRGDTVQRALGGVEPSAVLNSIGPTPRARRRSASPGDEHARKISAAPADAGGDRARTRRKRSVSMPSPDARAATLEASPAAAAPAPRRARPVFVVPDAIRSQFVQVGRHYNFMDGARAFTVHSQRLTTRSENLEVIRSMIAIAQGSGLTQVKIAGTERFRREAWFAAKLVGLAVRGYEPTAYDEQRLVRGLARRNGAHVAEPGPDRNDSAGRSNAPGASRVGPAPAAAGTPQFYRGHLVDHGAAPWRRKAGNAMSYFVRLEKDGREFDVWGVDLHRALHRSLTRANRGDEVGLREVRRDPVEVWAPKRDAAGNVTGQTKMGRQRTTWIVEKIAFFEERRAQARTFRDPRIDAEQGAQRHPNLTGAYLELQAARLVAGQAANPRDQELIVSAVRGKLAERIERGDPLPTAPLKERSARREDPRTKPLQGPEHEVLIPERG